MTSLIAWVGADSHGPASLNIATDSRITWRASSGSLNWDHGKKIFASSTVPLVVAFTGDVLFPAMVVPGIVDRIDRGLWRMDEALLDGFVEALRRGWREYPSAERRAVRLYIAHRLGDGMSSRFRLTRMSYEPGKETEWSIQDVPVPTESTFLSIDGSGTAAVEDALSAWQGTEAGGTSRAVFSGFVDGVVSGIDPDSGGAPQLGCIYRIGGGRLLGIVHDGQRYFAGSHLIGDEYVDGLEWRNALFERTDGRTKKRMAGAQPQPRPAIVPNRPRSTS